MKNIHFDQSLRYLHVNELKDYCARLALSTKGKKATLISRIIHFVETGEKIEEPKYPLISCSRNRKRVEPAREAFMLKGSYKNDLKARIFFKGLIGSHFHFTAFGIDWLEERWMAGFPPSYQEFAEMWQKEYLVRQENPAAPKTEWAYINFVKEYVKEHPPGNKEEILKQRDLKRREHKASVDKLMDSYLKSI